MIRNQWYAILDSKELRKDKLLGVIRFGEKLVLWKNRSGEVGCIFDKCTHRGAALSKGKILRNNMVQCPFHGFEYDSLGKVTKIPAYGKNTPVPERYKVHSYPAKDSYDLIWIWWGEQRDVYPPLPFFEDIDKKFIYASYKDLWAVHYSRAIENQLDVVHLPFVHHNTIGKGQKTLIDGPITKWVNDELRVWVYMRQDDGSKPLKENELPEPTTPSLLHFRFGNIWQNRLADNFRIFAAFVPVDEENIIIYLRLYQKFFRLPLLGQLLTRFSHRFNRIIINQDKRVVLTQQPKKSTLNINENLIRGDRPIIEYRKKRDELIKLNNT